MHYPAAPTVVHLRGPCYGAAPETRVTDTTPPMAPLRVALAGLAVAAGMAIVTAAADDAAPVVLAAGDIADCEQTLFAKALYNLLGIARAPGAEATAAIL